MVKNKLAEPVKVATSHYVTTTTYKQIEVSPSVTTVDASGATSTTPAVTQIQATSNSKLYKNYFFGRDAITVTNINQCTIVRGSDLKVEANHGYNINTTESDVKILQENLPKGGCFPNKTAATRAFW